MTAGDWANMSNVQLIGCCCCSCCCGCCCGWLAVTRLHDTLRLR